MNNPNKVVNCTGTGIMVHYTDTLKSHRILYDEQSILKSVQVNNSSEKTTHQKITTTQKELFNQAMYGLKSYTEEELKTMGYVQKMNIKDIHVQAQFKLNLWKQELMHMKLGSFLTTMFYKSSFAKSLATYPKSISPWDRTTVTFNELGITKEQITNKLIDLGILPKNYYELA